MDVETALRVYWIIKQKWGKRQARKWHEAYMVSHSVTDDDCSESGEALAQYFCGGYDENKRND